MTRNRKKNDGLPARVYERRGERIYSIGYKLPNGAWAFRYSCDVRDATKCAELRNQAVRESTLLTHNIHPHGPTEELINAWLDWQESLTPNDANRRADSTLRENKREAQNLIKAFGHIEPAGITKTDAYFYLDACVKAARASKGNKEISLLQVILEYGVRIGRLNTNPLDGVRKNKTKKYTRSVSDTELNLAVEIGRAKGGSRHIVAMALKTAWLCVRRSVEVRALTRDAITDAGIVWRDGKNKDKAAVLITWTPELRDTLTEALSIKRHHVAGAMYVFGNMRGQRYTKGGWKAVLDDLMQDCVAAAAQRGIAFAPFSLQDCRPKGVSDKLDQGHVDTQDATNHTNGKMIQQYYDRRATKKATPVK